MKVPWRVEGNQAVKGYSMMDLGLVCVMSSINILALALALAKTGSAGVLSSFHLPVSCAEARKYVGPLSAKCVFWSTTRVNHESESFLSSHSRHNVRGIPDSVAQTSKGESLTRRVQESWATHCSPRSRTSTVLHFSCYRGSHGCKRRYAQSLGIKNKEVLKVRSGGKLEVKCRTREKVLRRRRSGRRPGVWKENRGRGRGLASAWKKSRARRPAGRVQCEVERLQGNVVDLRRSRLARKERTVSRTYSPRKVRKMPATPECKGTPAR